MGNSRDADKFVVRLPDGMRERVAEHARAAHISMNSLVVQAVEQMLDRDSDEVMAVKLDEKSLDLLLVRLQERFLVATRGES